MKSLPSLLLVTLSAAACSGRGGDPASPPGPVLWPTGVYVLEATIQYRYDGESGTETIRDDHSAVLDIAPDGVMALRDSYGVCRERTPREAQRGKTFRCRSTEYALEMSGGTLGGEITASVTERIRVQDRCIGYRPGTTLCTQYQWNIDNRTTRKRARLTVVPRS